MKYLALVLLLVTDVALACAPMTYAQFQEQLKKEPAEELVFFASWCASCKKHLVPEQVAKSYFIASFDEEAAANKAFTAFLGKDALVRCIFDQDGSIAAAHGIKSLPAISKPKL
jgi:thiol-disulfide isomerase/thioredoxin